MTATGRHHDVGNAPERTDARSPWWRVLDLIGPDGRPFLRRRGFDLRRAGGIMAHRIDGPDPGLDLHDHPWWFATLILRGGYTEEVAGTRDAAAIAEHAADIEQHFTGLDKVGHVARGEVRTWARWSIHRMPLTVAHRITAVEPGTITLVVRWRKVRRWGFYLPRCPSHPAGGWVHWEDYDYAARRPLKVDSNRPGENR